VPEPRRSLGVHFSGKDEVFVLPQIGGDVDDSNYYGVLGDDSVSHPSPYDGDNIKGATEGDLSVVPLPEASGLGEEAAPGVMEEVVRDMIPEVRVNTVLRTRRPVTRGGGYRRVTQAVPQVSGDHLTFIRGERQSDGTPGWMQVDPGSDLTCVLEEYVQKLGMGGQVVTRDAKTE